jgi:hypothetical protein
MDTCEGSTKVSTILTYTQSESYSEWTTEPTSTTTTTTRRDFNIKGTSRVVRCRFQILATFFTFVERNCHDRQIDRQIDRQTDRQTDRQIDR